MSAPMQELPKGMASIGIGERLRSARQALGLSLEEIESVTHIRRSYLEALERETFEALPGPAYVRGFLRAYAACLGIPPQDLLDRYPAITVGEVSHRDSPVEVRITPAIRMSPARRAVMGVGLLVGLGVLFVGFVLYTQVREFALTAPPGTSPEHGAPRSPTAPSATATQPAPAPSAAKGGAPASPRGAPPPAGAPRPGASSTAPPPAPPPSTAAPPSTAQPGSSSPAPSPGAPARPAAPGPGGTPQTTPQGAPSASPSQPAPLNVAVAASGHAWVRTVADGAIVFEGFLNAGDKQIWQAKRSITVRVGNAAVVDIAVNGRSVGPLGGSGQVYEHTFSAGAPAP